jgi:hypothetical protein
LKNTELIHLDRIRYIYGEYESVYSRSAIVSNQCLKLFGFSEVQSKSPGNYLTLLEIRDIYLEKSAKLTHLFADLILFLPDAQADRNALQLTAGDEKTE